jgi:hypothetical protein
LDSRPTYRGLLLHWHLLLWTLLLLQRLLSMLLLQRLLSRLLLRDT